ncbi:MAG: 30S ribosomal protein S8 [Nitrospinota bacterium]|nr:MAG: 30S ribosomal protein S8 [Nitrospinota bacterium]
MSMSDPIADYLTRIRNAIMARHERVEIPGSRIKREITELLKREGYIQDYVWIEDNKQGKLQIELRYDGEESVIQGLRRISKPGGRVYVKAKEVPRVLNGLGIAILSTPQGLLTDRECRQRNVGGEVLCYVW